MNICKCPFLNTEFAFISSLIKRWDIAFALEIKKKNQKPLMSKKKKRTIVLLKPRNLIAVNGIG